MGLMSRRVEIIMGTSIVVDLPDTGVRAARREAAFDAVFAWFREVDARFSTYKADSEVCRPLSRGPSPDMRTVLDACEELRAATGGYFDAYATGHLDPSGFVKGWSVQVASDRLREAGIEDHCVNAGGDVRVRGHGADGEPWRIGIAHPWQRDKVAWVVAGTDLAIATSGTYERGFHVVDPYTGRGVDALCSVTVTGPDLGIADAYATAAVAMGERGLDWLAGLVGYESAAVTKAAEAYRSDGFPAIDVPDGPELPPYH